LSAALPEPRKIAIGAFHVGGDCGAAAPRHGADLKVLLNGLAHEGAAALRHMSDAEAGNILDGPAGQRTAAEANVSGDTHRARYRAQRRRLAGPVGAEQRGDAAFGHLKLKPEQHLGGAVESAKPDGLQQRRSHHLVVPRYAVMTSGLVRISP